MNDSVTSTPFESLESGELDTDHFETAVGTMLGGMSSAAATGYDGRGDNSKDFLQDEKHNSFERSCKEQNVTRNTNSPSVNIQQNTNSPNLNVPQNTNSPIGNNSLDTNSQNGYNSRNTNSANGQGATANTSNSSQTSASAIGNSGQNNKRVLKYPDYADELKRRGTFRNWPARLQQSPEMMSGAGFFYSMNGDSVRCYVCGIGLRNWDKDDDPWVEHARWSPNCSYVLDKKGRAFVNLVQEAVRNAELQEALRENNERHGNNAAAPGTGYAQSETDNTNTQNNVATSQTSGRRDQFPSDAERKNPLLCDAAQSVLNMGYLPRVIKQCIDELLKLEGWHSMSGKKLMKMIMEKEEVGDLDPVMSVVPTQRPPKPNTDKTSVPKARLEQENAALKERTSCKICLQNIVSIVFLPCGHLVSCAQCAPALKVCPICRGPMKATVRVSFG